MDKRHIFDTDPEILLHRHRYTVRVKITGPMSSQYKRRALFAITGVLKRYFDHFHNYKVFSARFHNPRPQSIEREIPEIKTAHERLGYFLGLHRNERRLTQEEFAALVGISRTHLIDIEKGRHKMSRKTQIKFEKVIPYKIADLLAYFNIEDPSVRCVEELKILRELGTKFTLRK